MLLIKRSYCHLRRDSWNTSVGVHCVVYVRYVLYVVCCSVGGRGYAWHGDEVFAGLHTSPRVTAYRVSM